ncbi:MAG: hypothetical protein EOP42_05615 [Sphingobacteriaceae bacterium]|nr:MAG: hypothetical protein EOP42_05615 [Sphingobacteriaceae bacterium]
MNDFFLEIDLDKLTLTKLEEYQLPFPVFKNDSLKLIFNTEEEYCDYLNQIEKTTTALLSEYWVLKTPELIVKNRVIIKVLTVLHEAKAKKDIQLQQGIL